MAKPNYRQAKRHKELARKARQEEKLRLRSTRGRQASESREPEASGASGESGQLTATADTMRRSLS
jgi:hypothetical protein